MQQLGRHFTQRCKCQHDNGAREKSQGVTKVSKTQPLKPGAIMHAIFYPVYLDLSVWTAHHRKLRVTSQLLNDIAAILPDEYNLPPPLTLRPTYVQQKGRGMKKQDT